MSGLKVVGKFLSVELFPSFETLNDSRRTFAYEVINRTSFQLVTVPLSSSSDFESKSKRVMSLALSFLSVDSNE